MADESEQMEEAVGVALVVMSETLANPRKVTPEMTKLWSAVLLDAGMRPADVEIATRRLMQTSTFFPTPADFLKAWKPPVDADAAAERAWQRVLSCVRRVGRYGSLAASDLGGDRAALWALSRVGWARLCQELTDEEVTRATFRNEFVRIFKLAARDGMQLAYLAGQQETENLTRGRDVTPILVGRPDWKALPPERSEEPEQREFPAAVPEMRALAAVFAGMPDAGQTEQRR